MDQEGDDADEDTDLQLFATHADRLCFSASKRSSSSLRAGRRARTVVNRSTISVTFAYRQPRALSGTVTICNEGQQHPLARNSVTCQHPGG